LLLLSSLLLPLPLPLLLPLLLPLPLPLPLPLLLPLLLPLPLLLLSLSLLLLSLPVLAVILSAAKDPDAPHPASISRIFPPTPPRSRRLLSNTKNKVQKVGKFSAANLPSFPATFSPQLHHDLPRKKPHSAHQISQNPQQKRLFRFQKNKSKKEDPETVLRSRGHRSAGGP
jgi:hypothetical protein